LLNLLGDFIAELRAAGLPISMTEHTDAATALVLIDLADKALVHDSLRATLVKDGDHLAAFDAAFAIFFATRRLGEEDAGSANGDLDSAMAGAGRHDGGGGTEPMSEEELAALIMRALLEGDAAMLAAAAAAAVARYAGMEPGRPVGGTYYLFRTLRNLDLDALFERLLEATPSLNGSALDERLARDAAREKIEALKRAVEEEIRERLVADRGADALARSTRRPLPEDLDVMHANRDEMAQLERALRPLSRKLAVRLARRRRHRHQGRVDLRATVRSSLSTGGVPIDLKFKPPRPAKPEIVVIADVSGSVASFARFTLMLVHAISAQFSKVRSFVFVDGLDEVTALFEGTDDPAVAVGRINAEADVIAFDGHSDYGRALLTFHEKYLDSVTRRTAVLILGDARNNYHQTHVDVVADLKYRAKGVYWLNPEPESYWNSGDSVISQYEPHCDRVIECRSLRQLESFVGTLA
jgi:uncharacterized protein